MKITIVDYGMGNIYSLQSALNYLGYDSICSSDHNEIINSDKIILPGVGSFKNAMENIKNLKLDLSLEIAVKVKQIPIFGICLGMQLLGESSTEEGFSEGLNLFPGKVDTFKKGSLKIPHVGFNSVSNPNNSILYSSLNNNLDFYFVHSYRMITKEKEGISFCNYGEEFVASFEYNNIFGTQFHPEKSQKNGLELINNFIKFKNE